jgi:shikimate dehydrogenase/3-dehydroquinate dehydratase type I
MMTLVVASLVERSIAGAARSSKEAFAAGADVVELRLDHLRDLARKPYLLDDARSAVDGPAIATLRSAREGGLSRLAGVRRAEMLEEVLDSGFDYVDLELAADRQMLERLRGGTGRTKTIGSYHFRRPATRSELADRLERACSLARIGKVAMPCGHAGHAATVAQVGLEFSEGRKEFALMGMGDQGQLTRACASGIGSKFVYACLPGRSAAPGQLDLSLQTDLVKPGAVVLGLIGHPVVHSVSKPMQEAALRSAGLRGIYLPLDVPPRSMGRAFVSTLFDVGLRGLNVTIPHKEKAYRICDSHGPSAASTRAVNTLTWTNGRIEGENTDLLGLSVLFASKKISLTSTDSLVIGAGGAARAACRTLTDGGSEVTVAARRAGAARAVARACNATGEPLSRIATDDRTYDIVVNATPIGTRGKATERGVIPVDALRGRPVFIDLVYNPPVTKSMELARSKGCRAIGGIDMLVGQGAESFRIWTGKTPDTARMREAARRALR